jgi:hypothetical protein
MFNELRLDSRPELRPKPVLFYKKHEVKFEAIFVALHHLLVKNRAQVFRFSHILDFVVETQLEAELMLPKLGLEVILLVDNQLDDVNPA